MDDFVDNDLVRAAGICACGDDDCQLSPDTGDGDWLEVMLNELAWSVAIAVAIGAVVLAAGQLWMNSGF